MFGDPAQLQPVGPHIWTDQLFGPFQVAVLKETKRQSDIVFIQLLNRMRLGALTDEDWDLLHSRRISYEQLDQMDLQNGAVLFPTNAFRKEYNERELRKHPGEKFTYIAQVNDSFVFLWC